MVRRLVARWSLAGLARGFQSLEQGPPRAEPAIVSDPGRGLGALRREIGVAPALLRQSRKLSVEHSWKYPYSLANRMSDFRWPERAPISLDDAWRFLAENPLPSDRFVLRSAGADEGALKQAEEALGRALPAILREALGRHDGIIEAWTNSGPFLAGARELAGEWARFRREWDPLQELVAAGELEEGDWVGIDPSEVQLDSLFPLGHEQGGHICFVLDVSRTSPAGEHPVLWFDPETPALTARWRSLGHFIAWIVCDAQCHPQRQRPPEMFRLFPLE